MATAIFENPGNTIEGRIERLQIMRSDGSIRESKQVNIHNTIVNGGLDNILTVGGFAQGSNTNNNAPNINYYNSNVSNTYPVLHYHLAQWIRMLWFMKLGTDTNNTMTFDNSIYTNLNFANYYTGFINNFYRFVYHLF